MHPTTWKTLLGNRDWTDLTRGQRWARIAVVAVLGFGVAILASWLYAVVMGNDFRLGGALSAGIGAAIGIAAVVYLNQRKRTPAASEVERTDDLPKRLG